MPGSVTVPPPFTWKLLFWTFVIPLKSGVVPSTVAVLFV